MGIIFRHLEPVFRYWQYWSVSVSSLACVKKETFQCKGMDRSPSEQGGDLNLETANRELLYQSQIFLSWLLCNRLQGGIFWYYQHFYSLYSPFQWSSPKRRLDLARGGEVVNAWGPFHECSLVQKGCSPWRDWGKLIQLGPHRQSQAVARHGDMISCWLQPRLEQGVGKKTDKGPFPPSPLRLWDTMT